MSERPHTSGEFAARLLSRAEGQLSALRPGIAPVFFAEQARAAVPDDWTAEVTVSEHETTATRQPTSVAFHVETPAPPPRSTAYRVVADPGHKPVFDPAPLQTTERSVGPQAAGPELPVPTTFARPDRRPDAERGVEPASVSLGMPRTVTIPPRQSPRPAAERGDTLSAAVMQLLGDGHGSIATTAPVAATAFPPEVTKQDSSVDRGFAETTSRESSVSADSPAERSLTIHIGEIVVAAEPAAAPRAAPQPWQPPLALSEYRARRAQERR